MTVTMGDWVWEDGFGEIPGAWILEATREVDRVLTSWAMQGGSDPDRPPNKERSDYTKGLLLAAIAHETA